MSYIITNIDLLVHVLNFVINVSLILITRMLKHEWDQLYFKCKSMAENINKHARTRRIKHKEPKGIKSTDSTQLLGWLNLLKTQATKPL